MEVDRVCYFYSSSFHPIYPNYESFLSWPLFDRESTFYKPKTYAYGYLGILHLRIFISTDKKNT